MAKPHIPTNEEINNMKEHEVLAQLQQFQRFNNDEAKKRSGHPFLPSDRSAATGNTANLSALVSSIATSFSARENHPQGGLNERQVHDLHALAASFDAVPDAFRATVEQQDYLRATQALVNRLLEIYPVKAAEIAAPVEITVNVISEPVRAVDVKVVEPVAQFSEAERATLAGLVDQAIRNAYFTQHGNSVHRDMKARPGRVQNAMGKLLDAGYTPEQIRDVLPDVPSFRHPDRNIRAVREDVAVVQAVAALNAGLDAAYAQRQERVGAHAGNPNVGNPGAGGGEPGAGAGEEIRVQRVIPGQPGLAGHLQEMQRLAALLDPARHAGEPAAINTLLYQVLTLSRHAGWGDFNHNHVRQGEPSEFFAALDALTRQLGITDNTLALPADIPHQRDLTNGQILLLEQVREFARHAQAVQEIVGAPGFMRDVAVIRHYHEGILREDTERYSRESYDRAGTLLQEVRQRLQRSLNDPAQVNAENLVEARNAMLEWDPLLREPVAADDDVRTRQGKDFFAALERVIGRAIPAPEITVQVVATQTYTPGVPPVSPAPSPVSHAATVTNANIQALEAETGRFDPLPSGKKDRAEEVSRQKAAAIDALKVEAPALLRGPYRDYVIAGRMIELGFDGTLADLQGAGLRIHQRDFNRNGAAIQAVTEGTAQGALLQWRQDRNPLVHDEARETDLIYAAIAGLSTDPEARARAERMRTQNQGIFEVPAIVIAAPVAEKTVVLLQDEALTSGLSEEERISDLANQQLHAAIPGWNLIESERNALQIVLFEAQKIVVRGGDELPEDVRRNQLANALAAVVGHWQELAPYAEALRALEAHVPGLRGAMDQAEYQSRVQRLNFASTEVVIDEAAQLQGWRYDEIGNPYIHLTNENQPLLQRLGEMDPPVARLSVGDTVRVYAEGDLAARVRASLGVFEAGRAQPSDKRVVNELDVYIGWAQGGNPQPLMQYMAGIPRVWHLGDNGLPFCDAASLNGTAPGAEALADRGMLARVPQPDGGVLYRVADGNMRRAVMQAQPALVDMNATQEFKVGVTGVIPVPTPTPSGLSEEERKLAELPGWKMTLSGKAVLEIEGLDEETYKALRFSSLFNTVVVLYKTVSFGGRECFFARDHFEFGQAVRAQIGQRMDRLADLPWEKGEDGVIRLSKKGLSAENKDELDRMLGVQVTEETRGFRRPGYYCLDQEGTEKVGEFGLGARVNAALERKAQPHFMSDAELQADAPEQGQQIGRVARGQQNEDAQARGDTGNGEPGFLGRFAHGFAQGVGQHYYDHARATLGEENTPEDRREAVWKAAQQDVKNAGLGIVKRGAEIAAHVPPYAPVVGVPPLGAMVRLGRHAVNAADRHFGEGEHQLPAVFHDHRPKFKVLGKELPVPVPFWNLAAEALITGKDVFVEGVGKPLLFVAGAVAKGVWQGGKEALAGGQHDAPETAHQEQGGPNILQRVARGATHVIVGALDAAGRGLALSGATHAYGEGLLTQPEYEDQKQQAFGGTHDTRDKLVEAVLKKFGLEGKEAGAAYGLDAREHRFADDVDKQREASRNANPDVHLRGR